MFQYSWKNNEKRLTLYRRICRVVSRFALNSALVEFENGQREVISRNALRKCRNEALQNDSQEVYDYRDTYYGT